MPTNNERILSYAEALAEAIVQSMEEHPDLLVIGEGVPDPKGIFNTTSGLQKQFGLKRVFDMPLSENGMTGICLGAALDGLPVLMIHQRIDFSLLALDQIINNIAKWSYMFNGVQSVPMVIRLIIGRGWGQGPQHSQSLHALFAKIPGLKVIMPATARDAKGMMMAALNDSNPVIFIEHRWLHHIRDSVPAYSYSLPMQGARVIRQGNRATIVTISYALIECIKVAKTFAQYGIELEIIDLRSVRPLDISSIADSVCKSGRLIVVDIASRSTGIASEVISQFVENYFSLLSEAPLKIAPADHPIPTSHYLADHYYQDAEQIAQLLIEYLQLDIPLYEVRRKLSNDGPLDVPDKNFHGPF